MGSMQSKVEFEYQLRISPGPRKTTENRDRVGRSQDLVTSVIPSGLPPCSLVEDYVHAT
jgi:hypothetical protein